MDALITIDIGGTSMRAAVYPSHGIQPIAKKKIPTHSSTGSVFEDLTGLIRSIWPEGTQISAISVASAGHLDPKTGYIYDSPNIAGWKEFPLGEKLTKKFSVPVFVGNDANLAALGEWKHGSGIGYSDLIYLTISTGIGGGIISKNILLEGHKGLAAELGHITVQPDGPSCSCGKNGHLEAVSSGLAIVEYTRSRIKDGEKSILNVQDNYSAYDVALAAKKGDELSLYAFQYAGYFLGQALASFVHIFNPSIIIIGGGVSNSGALLFDPIIEKIRMDVMNMNYINNLEIVPAKLGDEAGLVGALTIAKQKLNIS